MRGYDREELRRTPEDGYDDYYDGEDGYGEEEDEGEEYEEEDPQPTKEEMEYLELRQRLKEQIRKKNERAVGSALNNSNDRKRKLPYDNYGSFFGPSKPVISQRVIQESKSLLETQHLTPKVSNGHLPSKKSTGSSTAGSKPGVQSMKSRVMNEVKSKVQKLKDTRDYSFLLSDEAQIPAPAKVAPQPPAPVRTSDARPAQVPLKSKQASVSNGRQVNGSHGERKHAPTNGHVYSKAESNRLPSTSRPKSAPVDSRRPHSSSSNGSGPGRPLGPKAGLHSKAPSSVEKRAPTSVARSSHPNMQRSLSSSSQPSSRSLPPPRSQLPSRSQPTQRSQPPSRSQPPPRSQSSLKSQPSSKSQPSISRQQMEQRRELQGSTKAKMLPKQSTGLSRPQVHKPQRPISSHHISHDNRPKKRLPRRYSDDEDDDGEAAISMIRQMFRYNPNKFADRDDDLSDMEANFDDIMREEKLSARYAKKEDEEQLRLIEAEEKAERLAKLKRMKKR